MQVFPSLFALQQGLLPTLPERISAVFVNLKTSMLKVFNLGDKIFLICLLMRKIIAVQMTLGSWCVL
jgi:hypothetical protein